MIAARARRPEKGKETLEIVRVNITQSWKNVWEGESGGSFSPLFFRAWGWRGGTGLEEQWGGGGVGGQG